jgi:hypothetical protein
MEEKKPNPQISWRTLNDKECLYFTFKGTLTKNDATSAIGLWKSFLETKNGMQIHIWNCTEMKGYEPSARSIWQDAIKDLKHSIEAVWLISDSAIIRTGASIMSLFTKFSLKVVSKEDDICC